MKEILFKGKRTDNNKWIEGFYVKHDESPYIYTGKRECIVLPIYVEKGIKYEVNPETVCQYTGLIDSTKWEELSENEKEAFLSKWNCKKDRQNIKEDWNGRKIFEGDILNVTYSDQVGECHYVENYLLDDLRNTSVIGWLDYANEIEIVGNRFDNPELLQN